MLKNKWCVAAHFVWATWDRQPLIPGDIQRDLYRCMETVCRDDRCEVLAIGGMADLMKHVKGGSSRFVTKKLKPGTEFAWQGSYGAFSVSRSHLRDVIGSIETQEQHHALGPLWPHAEETSGFGDAMPAQAATRRPRPTA